MFVDKKSREYKFAQTLGDMTKEAADEFGEINEIEELDSCRIDELQDCIYLLLNHQFKGKPVKSLCVTPLRGQWVSVWGNLNY